MAFARARLLASLLALMISCPPGRINMSKRLPFTEFSLARAIRGIQRAGLFVVGVKPDGTLIVSDKPLDTTTLVPVEGADSSDITRGDLAASWDDFRCDDAPSSKWKDKLAHDHNGPPPTPKRRFEKRLSDVASQSEEMATPPRAHDRPRRRRGGGWGYFATVDDPKVIESYRAAGFAVYEDGELEELIRKSPMGKREAAALGGFFRARSEPTSVKGAGLQITSRLVTRGYIEVAESHGDCKHRITPAGEAEWLRMTNNSSS